MNDATPLPVRPPVGCSALRPHDRERPTACLEHMPFFGHRTMAEVWEQEARHEILRLLTRNGRRKGKTNG